LKNLTKTLNSLTPENSSVPAVVNMMLSNFRYSELIDFLNTLIVEEPN